MRGSSRRCRTRRERGRFGRLRVRSLQPRDDGSVVENRCEHSLGGTHGDRAANPTPSSPGLSRPATRRRQVETLRARRHGVRTIASQSPCDGRAQGRARRTLVVPTLGALEPRAPFSFPDSRAACGARRGERPGDSKGKILRSVPAAPVGIGGIAAGRERNRQPRSNDLSEQSAGVADVPRGLRALDHRQDRLRQAAGARRQSGHPYG